MNESMKDSPQDAHKESTKESTIADDFLTNPAMLYDAPENLSPEARRELFELEESLAAVLFFEQTRDALNNPADRQVPAAVDALLGDEAGSVEALASLNPAQRAHAIQTYFDTRAMHDPALPSEAVPEVLKLVIERTLRVNAGEAAQDRAIPAIVLQIRDGLRVIKSALQGMEFQTDALATTRSSVAAPEARRSHVVLKQTVDGRAIEYQILSESAHAVTLIVRFPGNNSGLKKLRALLRHEGRMLDSRSPDASGQLSFEHLQAGAYDLEFTGTFQHTCPILIQD